jgi:SAM-dependent methyltransferase
MLGSGNRSLSGHVDVADPATGALPYECGAFDVVTCWDGAAVNLAEINRVLQPEGLLVLTSRSSPERLRRSLEQAGLSAEGVSEAGEGLTLAVARKVDLPRPDLEDESTVVAVGGRMRA